MMRRLWGILYAPFVFGSAIMILVAATVSPVYVDLYGYTVATVPTYYNAINGLVLALVNGYALITWRKALKSLGNTGSGVTIITFLWALGVIGNAFSFLTGL